MSLNFSGMGIGNVSAANTSHQIETENNVNEAETGARKIKPVAKRSNKVAKKFQWSTSTYSLATFST